MVSSPQALIRAVLAAMPSLPAGSLLVPVPLPLHREVPTGPAARARELAAWARVAAAYGATQLMADGTAPAAADLPPGADLLGSAPIPILASGDWAYDPRAEVWRPHALIEAGTEQEDLSADQLGDLLDDGQRDPALGHAARLSRANCGGYAGRGPSEGSCCS